MKEEFTCFRGVREAPTIIENPLTLRNWYPAGLAAIPKQGVCFACSLNEDSALLFAATIAYEGKEGIVVKVTINEDRFRFYEGRLFNRDQKPIETFSQLIAHGHKEILIDGDNLCSEELENLNIEIGRRAAGDSNQPYAFERFHPSKTV